MNEVINNRFYEYFVLLFPANWLLWGCRNLGLAIRLRPTLISQQLGLKPEWPQSSVLQKTTLSQSALELGSAHCPNGGLGQHLGLGRFVYDPKVARMAAAAEHKIN